MTQQAYSLPGGLVEDLCYIIQSFRDSGILIHNARYLADITIPSSLVFKRNLQLKIFAIFSIPE